MKTANLSRRHSPRGLSIVEVSMVIALISGLVIIITLGMSAYRRGAHTASCLQQQHRIIKEATAYLMHEIPAIDQAAQRSNITASAHHAMIPLYVASDRLFCPGLVSVSDEYKLNAYFGSSDESEIYDWYGQPFDELMMEWYGFSLDSPEASENLARYSVALSITSDNSNNLSTWASSYGIITMRVGTSAYCYVACQKSWGASGRRTKDKKYEFHNNW